jgi:hypothetical protein
MLRIIGGTIRVRFGTSPRLPYAKAQPRANHRVDRHHDRGTGTQQSSEARITAGIDFDQVIERVVFTTPASGPWFP